MKKENKKFDLFFPSSSRPPPCSKQQQQLSGPGTKQNNIRRKICVPFLYKHNTCIHIFHVYITRMFLGVEEEGNPVLAGLISFLLFREARFLLLLMLFLLVGHSFSSATNTEYSWKERINLFLKRVRKILFQKINLKCWERQTHPERES